MRKIKIGSDCSGIGAFNQALKRLNIDYEETFACDFDYFARVTFIANYGTEDDLKLALTKEHKIHSDNVKRIVYENKTENTKEDIDLLNKANEFGKKFSFYYPFNMYERDIPQEPNDLYVSSIPCQSFSLSGKRLGKNDPKGRGILFFQSLKFIEQNKPRFFIFENVKGLLSADGGDTFNEWLNYLGGKSVNGTGTMFPVDGCVPYHIYWKVLNAKDYGVPQNRERVFIVGIRDDKDSFFNFPKVEPLTKRLKDVLEPEVEEKYYLSEKGIQHIYKKEGVYTGINENEARCLTTRYSASLAGSFIEEPKIISNTRIRKLTPIEAFRLMDFPDLLVENARKAGISDSQLYRQAGNSIVVAVLEKIIKNLKLF
jgi:DNA (cytosine-5)-methyltransferase 1